MEGKKDSSPLSNDNGDEFQEREVQSEEKEDLSDHYINKHIWRNYQEIVDNHRKKLGKSQSFLNLDLDCPYLFF